MTENYSFDFGDIEGQHVERLRAPKVQPVPYSVVKLAQRSLDGMQHPDDPDKVLHVMNHQFQPGEEGKRDAFVKHMRNAGMHTTPVSSVTVVTDPDHTGNDLLVAWRAGARRGRAAS